jgi:hypothetical protein
MPVGPVSPVMPGPEEFMGPEGPASLGEFREDDFAINKIFNPPGSCPVIGFGGAWYSRRAGNLAHEGGRQQAQVSYLTVGAITYKYEKKLFFLHNISLLRIWNYLII